MGFKAHVEALLFQKGWTLTWTISGVFDVVGLVVRKGIEYHHTSIGILIIFCALVVWGTWPLLLPEGLNAERQFTTASLICWCHCHAAGRFDSEIPSEWIESKASRLGQWLRYCSWCSLLADQRYWQWHRDVGRLQAVLSSSRNCPAPCQHSGTSSMEADMDFDWTWPCLSIALNPDRQIRSLVCSEFMSAHNIAACSGSHLTR